MPAQPRLTARRARREPGTIGYHCDNRKLYEGQGEGRATAAELAGACRAGDTIRCCVEREAQVYRVRYLLNGILPNAALVTPARGPDKRVCVGSQARRR